MNKSEEQEIRRKCLDLAFESARQLEKEGEESFDKLRQKSFNESESIYYGLSGLILFFTRLYGINRQESYLNTIERHSRLLLASCRENPSRNYAFYTGKSGACFTLLEISRATGNIRYLEDALDLFLEGAGFIEASPVEDIMNGSSGMLLTALHLHEASADPRLIPVIDKLISRIISRACLAKHGVYWDRSHHNISGLCGFAHGASGIAFVLLQAAKYLDSKALLFLAELGMLYERRHYNSTRNNYPDLRKIPLNKPGIEESIQDFSYPANMKYYRPAYMNAWCHGATGIGMCRIEAYSVLKRGIYKKEFLAAVRKTEFSERMRSGISNLSLCHASGGSIELYLESFRQTKDMRFYRKALDLISGFKEGASQQPGLFTGKVGEAYTFLKAAHPGLDSILLPRLASSEPAKERMAFKTAGISLGEMKKMLLSKAFPKTLAHAGMEAGFKGSALEQLKIMEKKVKGRNKSVSQWFHLEKKKLKLDLLQKSHAYTYLKESGEQLKARQYISGGNGLNMPLRLNPDVKIFTLKEEKADRSFILKRSAYGTLENEVPELIAGIIKSFRVPQRSHNLIKKIIRHEHGENAPEVEQFISDYIKEAFLAGILIPASPGKLTRR